MDPKGQQHETYNNETQTSRAEQGVHIFENIEHWSSFAHAKYGANPFGMARFTSKKVLL